MDLDFLYALQQLREQSSVLATVMNLCSYLADEILIVLILCVLYWCLNKDYAYRLCFSYFVSGLMVQGLKVAFRIARPWVRDPGRLHPDPVAEPKATGYSFPSGHTQTATSLYGAYAFLFKKWWSFLSGFVLIALVMFSRMFLGCHTPQDVLVSFGISIVLVILISLIYEKVTFTKKKRMIVCILVELASVFVTVFTCLQISSGRIKPDDYGNAYDAIKCAGAGLGFGISYFIERTYLNFDPKQTKKIWVQILKVIIGLGIALLFKELPKKLIGDTTPTAAIIAIHMIRYILTIVWVILLYPFLFSKVIGKFSKK